LSKSTSTVKKMTIPENKLTRNLQLFSSALAITGGVMLASNTSVSSYGFIFLAFSSGSMLITNTLLNNKSMIIYAASLFVFVDCLGIYRWIIK
jgi:uncharacterized membrane protein